MKESRRQAVVALLAKIDREIAEAQAVTRAAPTALVRQQAKMLMESLKLDREAD
jgi:hypothetical protein